MSSNKPPNANSPASEEDQEASTSTSAAVNKKIVQQNPDLETQDEGVMDEADGSDFVEEPLSSYPSLAIRNQILSPLLHLHNFYPYIWNFIRNKSNLKGPVLFSVQRRVPSFHAFEFSWIQDAVQDALRLIDKPGKVQISLGILTEDLRTADYGFFYASHNTTIFQETPLPVVRSEEDIINLCAYIGTLDVAEQLIQQTAANTQRVFRGFACCLVRLYKLPNEPEVLVGAACGDGQGTACHFRLPRELAHCRQLVSFHPKMADARRKDFCFFRCLYFALHRKKFKYEVSDKRLEAGAEKLAKYYCKKKNLDFPTFRGPVNLNDVAMFEKALKCRFYFFTYTTSHSRKVVAKPVARGRSACKIQVQNRPALTIYRRPESWSRGWAPIYFVLLPGVQDNLADEGPPVQHCCLLKNVHQFLGIFICDKCGGKFSRAQGLRIHSQTVDCQSKTGFVKTGPKRKCYDIQHNLFDLLEAFGVDFDPGLRKTTFYATFDCETMPVELPSAIAAGGGSVGVDKKLSLESELQLICIAVASRVPGFESRCWFCLDSPQDLVDELLFELKKMSDWVFRTMTELHAPLLEQLETLACSCDEKELNNPYRMLKSRLLKRWRILPIYSYFGKKFDHALCLPFMAWRLELAGESPPNVLKKANSYLQIACENFRFIDASCLVSEGQSLASLLDLYQISQRKLAFPHSFNGPALLAMTKEFPPRSMFANRLKGNEIHITEAEYINCVHFFHQYCGSSMKIYLMKYCLIDCLPLLDALEAHFRLFWDNFHLDLPSFLTLPSVSHNFYMNKRKWLLPFWLPRVPVGGTHISDDKFREQTQKECRIYREIYEGLQGGFSCIFTRAQLRGITPIPLNQERAMAESGQLHRRHICGCISSLDYNSLYPHTYEKWPEYVLFPQLWERGSTESTKQLFMPTSFAPKKISEPEMQMVIALDNCLFRSEITYHTLRGDQWKPFAARKWYVDYYVPRLGYIFELQGCYFHPVSTCLQRDKIEKSLGGEKEFQRKADTTKFRIDQLKQHFTVFEVQSCMWDEMIQTDFPDPNLPAIIRDNSQAIVNFVRKYFYDNDNNFNRSEPYLTEDDLLKKIQFGSNFKGLLKAELYPPTEEVREKFRLYPPLFCREDVDAEMLGVPLENWARSGNLRKPRMQLISVTEHKSPQLVDSDFVVYLLDMGYKVRNVQFFLRFKTEHILEEPTKTLVNLRRSSDNALLGNVCKLLLNRSQVFLKKVFLKST